MTDQELKERLTGAAVLVVLGVVFIPLFLDGPAQSQPEQDRRTLALPGPATPAPGLEPAAQSRPGPEVSTPARKVTAEQPVARPAERVPEDPLSAWAVQVGSFASQDNAERLRDTLRTKGYRAFVTRLNEENRTLYRVRVGPEQDRERAELLARRLTKEGQSTAIVRHP